VNRQRAARKGKHSTSAVSGVEKIILTGSLPFLPNPHTFRIEETPLRIMAPVPWNGSFANGIGNSQRRVQDDVPDNESLGGDDSASSSMVSSITRQSLATNRARESLSKGRKSDVEGGVPVTEGPLEQVTAPDSKLPFWQRNKKYIILGVIGMLIVVIAVVVSVVVTGDDGSDGSPSREEALTDIMSTVSTDESLSTEGTPQFKANEWLIKVDSLKLTPSETVTDERVLQRYSLAVLYYATGGPDSWNPNSWLTGDECSGQYWTGISCDDDRRVRAMAFGKNCFVFLVY
jgi:hypothetical protein